MTGLTNWLSESNRYKHLLGGLLIGMCADTTFCALYTGACVGGALELKDKQCGGKWDWYDFGCTFIGAALGRAIVLGLRWALKGGGA